MIEVASTYHASQVTHLKGETLCAELCDNGIPHEDFFIKRLGGFKQRYRDDVERVDVGTDDYGVKQLFELWLNRDGIYDVLPEGLFHQTKGSARTTRLEDMIEEHKQFKEEEKEARKFFMPLEHEFFMYGVRVEQQERAIQHGFIKGQFPDALYRFWEISRMLPPHAQEVFMRIMPWVKHITGSIHYTKQVLELLVQKRVIATTSRKERIGTKSSGFTLGDRTLGETTVSGRTYEDDVLKWTFIITDLSPQECGLFIPGASMRNVIDRFDEVFIPIYVDTQYEYETTVDSKDGDVCVQYVGYNMVL